MASASSLRHAFRRLLRAPGFTTPALLILTLGIAATTGIFAVVKGVLLDPLPLPESDRLVLVCEEHPEALPFCGVASAATISDFRREARSFEDLGTLRNWNFAVRDDRGTASLDAGLVTPGLLDLMGVQPAMGRLFTPDEVGEDRDDVVILSHGLWARRYGSDPDVLGRTLDTEGELSTIVGVMPPGFEVPGAEWVEFYKPIPWDLSDPEVRAWRGHRAFGRLEPGVSREQARGELEELYRRLGERHEAITGEWRVGVRSLVDFVVGSGTRDALLVFLGAVGLLLLIGCINVANLLLVRGARQEGDFAVRYALGARRVDLVGQVLTESLLLAGLAGIAGLALAWGALEAFRGLAPPYFPRLEDVGLGWEVVVFVLGLTVLTALLFGLPPALRSSGGSTATILRSGHGHGSTRGAGTGLRRVLVVVELALSLVLLAAAGLLTRSFLGFLDWDPGFETENLVFFQAFVPSDRYPEDADVIGLWRAVEEHLEALPSVRAVATASGVPLRSSSEGVRYRVAGQEAVPVPELPSADFFDVGPGYFRTMGMRLVRGREFTEGDDLESPPVVMVNQTLAERAWPGQDPLGRTLWTDWTRETVEVVGVAADLEPLRPGERAPPIVYFPNRQKGVRTASMLAVRVEGDPPGQASLLRDAILAVESGFGVSSRGTVESLLRGHLASPRFNMALVGVFALAAAILAGLGTYGVLAYLVVERRREFGIRIALGSSRRRVLRSVLREGVVLATLGVVLGLAGSLAGSSLLKGVVHGVEPTDPATLSGTSLLLLLLALVACAAPAYRASRVDPVTLLRDS